MLGKPRLVERLAPISRDVRPLTHLGLFDRLEEVLRADPALANHFMPDDEGPTPLFCLPDDEDAALEAARILLRHGADPGIRNKQGRTAIEAARGHGFEEVAELMEG